MRFDLKKPCLNCPFGKADTRIRFRGKDRAREIEELAYRQGFPCHLSATIDDEDDEGGYEFGPNTQHCAGAIGMFLNGDYTEWPGIDNDDRIAEVASERLGREGLAMCFDSPEDFVEANADPEIDDD